VIARFVVIAVAVLVLVATAFATNPRPDRHAEAIRTAVKAERPIAGALGLGHLEAYRADYRDLGVASYTTIAGEVRSIGAFGMVHVMAAAAGDER
jgi:hypothetical protein